MNTGIEEIRIPLITLRWSEWVHWERLIPDLRYGSGVRVPPQSGVYEAWYDDVMSMVARRIPATCCENALPPLF